LVAEKPYSEILTSDSIIRKFSQDIDPIELMWHRDLKNRSVKLVSGSGWKIQLENNLPIEFTEILIPKLAWHRVIKGTDDLVVEIKEWD
jgi:hypothetical protein